MRGFLAEGVLEAMTRRLTGVLFLASVAACRCGPDINMVDSRFRVVTERVEFGRVLENTIVTKQVTLVAETRAAVTVGAQTQAPFSSQAVIEIEGGGQLDVDVSFRAGEGEVSGELVLTSGRQEVRVPLRGIGVHPPVCLPSANCRMSMYSLEEDRCVETMSPDETPCEPDSQCLEQGRCRSGQCLGVARRCNDNDACTSDACAMDAGCVHTRIICPTPSAPCRVPTCDARTGCGEGVAPDGTLCGASDCTSSKVCASGSCIEVPTPDGTLCGPPIACYGEMTCHDKQCVRPDAGAWIPDWSAHLDDVPNLEPPALIVFNGAIYFTTCRAGFEARVDGGELPDAGSDDGGFDDAGTDAGTDDAGTDDAGLADDAGFPCTVLSYTGTGFDRFIVPVAERELLAGVNLLGIALRTDAGLRFRSRSTGAALGSAFTGPVTATQYATLSDDGGVVVVVPGDGGSYLVIDTPTASTPLAFVPGAVSHLAAGLDDTVFAYTPAGIVWRTRTDGGTWVESLTIDAGTPLLATADDALVASSTLVHWLSDGGTRLAPLVGPPDSVLEGREVVVTPSTVFLFFRACTVLPMSCLPDDEATWVRAFSRETGAVTWEDKVLPEHTNSRLIDFAALRLPGTSANALAAIVEGSTPTFANGLIVSVDGGRALECLFTPTTGRVLAAAFTPGQLITLSQRWDGGVALEGWSLGALPLETQGWRSPEGASGQRRPAP